MKVGSLFAGIGGMDLGLERAGFDVAWQVEIDDYAQKVLAKHWPDVARFRDVRECGAHNLATVDLICGGFPCQDISNAGKRAGITGERSGLWVEFARIIGELRPRYALIENVSALLGRGLDVVLCDLAAIGFNVEWHCIPAAAVGAPHIRDRVFILAHAQCKQGGERYHPDGIWRQEEQAEQIRLGCGDVAHAALLGCGSGWQGRSDTSGQGQSEQSLQDVSDTNSDQYQSGAYAHQWERAPIISRYPTAAEWWAVEPGMGRVAHGVPRRVDRLRGLGNAVVPQVAEFVGRAIIEHARANP